MLEYWFKNIFMSKIFVARNFDFSATGRIQLNFNVIYVSMKLHTIILLQFSVASLQNWCFFTHLTHGLKMR